MDRILSHSPIGIAVIDFSGNFVEFNAAYSALYAYDHEDLKREKFTVLFRPEQRASVLARHQEFLTDGQPLRGEWDVVRHDGVPLVILSESVRVDSESGEPLRLVYVVDITQRRRAEKALVQSEGRLSAIIATALDAVMCLDQNQEVTVFNPAAETMFGYCADQILGKSVDVLLPENSRKLHAHDVQASVAADTVACKMGLVGRVLGRRASGALFPVEASISHGKFGDETVFTVIVRDITEQVLARKELDASLEKLRQANQQLRELSEIDHLTLLPNRRLLFERLRLALSQAKRRENSVCLAYIDLDGFKAINDTHGHDAGDAILVKIAFFLRQQLRDGDTLARIGGDEFIALLIDVDSIGQCLPTVERIGATASQVIQHGGLQLQVSASIGVALSGKESDTDGLIARADHAMYQAKQAGKNRYAIAA